MADTPPANARTFVAVLLFLGAICLLSANPTHMSQYLACMIVGGAQLLSALVLMAGIDAGAKSVTVSRGRRWMRISVLLTVSALPLAFDVYRNGNAWALSSAAPLMCCVLGVGVAGVAAKVSTRGTT